MLANKNSIYRYPSELEELDKEYESKSRNLLRLAEVSLALGIGTYFSKGLADSLGQDIDISSFVQGTILSLPILANTFMGKKLDDIIQKYNTIENKNLPNNNNKKTVLFNSTFYGGAITAGVCGITYALGNYVGNNLK